MKAVKALQEAMELIETLEAKVAALEARSPTHKTRLLKSTQPLIRKLLLKVRGQLLNYQISVIIFW